MNIYATQGFNEFIIATGYKGEVISNWVGSAINDSWNVIALDTGLNTMTSGRIRKCMELVPGERVMVTYGDGLGNININKLIQFHQTKGTIATVTAVRPPARFGVLESENGLVTHFGEKNQTDAGWINGGFFVLEASIREYLGIDSQPFELSALPELARSHQLGAFHHHGFWQPMDTLREKEILAEMTFSQIPPWLLGLNTI